jgi:hypothetical protein
MGESKKSGLSRDQRRLAKALGLPHRKLKTRAALWTLRAAWRAAVLLLRQGRVWWRALLPVYLAVAVWLVAAVASLVEKGAATVGTLAAVSSVPVYWWLGLPAGRLSRRRRVKPLVQRCWYGGAYIAVCGLAVLTAGWRLGPPMPGLWGAATGAVWVAWLWHHRVRIEDAIDDALDPRQETWQKVKGMGKTALVDIKEFDKPKRWEADVDLSDTDLLVADVVAAVPHIAKAFVQPRMNVIADYKPGRLESRARLTVVAENPCETPVVYDESWIPTEAEIADGCVPFHFYPNGQRGLVRLWQSRAGTLNTLFSGDIGSGKSGGMEAKGIQAMFTGRVWPMAGDPQGGASMPALCGAQGVARWQAPCSEDDLGPIEEQLLFLKEAMYDRAARLSRFEWVDEYGDERIGLNGWDFDITGWPAIGYSLDEVWKLMQNEALAALVKELLKMQRKVGFYMDMATQYPGIEEFNNDMAIRQCLTAGNLLAYRNTAGSVKEMILPKGTPTPFEIPSETLDGDHTRGMLSAVSQAPRSSLPVYGRSVWAKRNVFWARRAAARVPELDEGTARILRKYRPSAVPLSVPAQREPVREVVEVSAPAAVAQPARRETVLERVVAYLGSRPDRRAHTGVIAEALDIPKGSVSTTLRRAADRSGAVHQVRVGIWALGAPPQAEQLPIGEAAERAA